MSLNPLSIAHLGIARRPIVAALLGLWDEIMEALAEAGGGYVPPAVRPAPPRPAPRPSRPRRPTEDDEASLLLALA